MKVAYKLSMTDKRRTQAGSVQSVNFDWRLSVGRLGQKAILVKRWVTVSVTLIEGERRQGRRGVLRLEEHQLGVPALGFLV